MEQYFCEDSTILNDGFMEAGLKILMIDESRRFMILIYFLFMFVILLQRFLYIPHLPESLSLHRRAVQ